MDLFQQLKPSSMLSNGIKLTRACWNGWERFWFNPADPATLGFMRWFVGGMLVYTHFVWGLQLESFFGSTGFHTENAVSFIAGDRLMPSLWWLIPDSHLMLTHCVCMSILVMFWIGFATRVTSVLSMVITISYAYRAHMANFGLDQINSILCLYLCIGPSGAVLSVDNLIRRWWRGTSLPAKPSVSANVAVRLIQIHFCIIYVFAGLSKLQGDAWWNGEAVWMAFANLEYQSMDMTWVAWYPWLSDVMTHTTILWEVSFAALIWVRALRPMMLIVGFGLHFGIGAAMGMWTFGLIMIFGHIAFWSPTFLRRVIGVMSLGKVDLPKLDSVPDVQADRQTVSKPVFHKTEDRLPVGPALILVDAVQSRRLLILNYFKQRGYRCLPAASTREADAVCDSVSPDAVVVVGSNIPDGDIVKLQTTHEQRDEQLFLVLSQSQSRRLGPLPNGSTHVLDASLAIGSLRTQIEEKLQHSEAESN